VKVEKVQIVLFAFRISLSTLMYVMEYLLFVQIQLQQILDVTIELL